MSKEDNLKKFKKGYDPRRNVTGQNRKNYTTFVQDMKEKGYHPPTKSEYMEMVGMLMVMTEESLREIETDISQPFWIRRTILDLKNSKEGSKIRQEYRDWLFGKADQKIQVTDPVGKFFEDVNSEIERIRGQAKQ